MNTIIQLDREELRSEFRTCLRELINEIRELPAQPEPPKRMTVEDTVQYFRDNGIPITKSKLYKDSMLKTIPVEKFGKRLVFDRKKIDEWIGERTVAKSKVNNIATERLAREANRKI
ncbi:MAG: hypothetical protein JXB00_06140 [Bacteroidales bacterium]|nr:hypothetical protein [Bacteroidales bacterium]